MKKKHIDYLRHIAFPVLIYGIITGAVVGTVLFAFKFGVEWILHESHVIYDFVSANPAFIPLLLAGLVGLALLEHFLQKWSPETQGMCVPYASGAVKGILPFRWFRAVIGVIVNSFISFFAGLPLGSEGPAVLLGASLADGTSRLPLANRSWRKYIMTGGACAGFAVVTGAPLAGVFFGLEEAHKKFTPTLLLMCIFTVISGYLTSALWSLAFQMEMEPWIHLPHLGEFSIGDIGYLALLGIAIGLLSCLFNFVIDKSGKFFDAKLKRIPRWVRMVAIFVVVGVVGIFLVDALYGGHHTVEYVAEEHFELWMLFLLFAVRFILTVLCCSVGATGDLVIPMFALGALTGGIMAKLFVAMGMDSSLVSIVVLISMAAFMGVSTGAPITAIIFIIECSWNFSNVFYIAIVVFIGLFLSQALKIEPLYDVVIERMVEHHHHGHDSKIFECELVVQKGSFAVHKCVRDILWPENAIVKDIVSTDEKKHMDNFGERKFHSGDKVTLVVETFDFNGMVKELCEVFGKQPTCKVCEDSTTATTEIAIDK